MIAKVLSVFTAAENSTMSASGMSLANHGQIDAAHLLKHGKKLREIKADLNRL